MAQSDNIHIGTSGWHYKDWEGRFYPEDLPKNDSLAYYAEHFHTLEINNSFYQLPKTETLTMWRKAVPSGFLFAVKASRYITHMKKLKDAEAALTTFLNRVDVLGDELGPILFQPPPRWRFNPDRFYDFLEALPGITGMPLSFETRPGWTLRSTRPWICSGRLSAFTIWPDIVLQKRLPRTSSAFGSMGPKGPTRGNTLFRRFPDGRAPFPPGWTWGERFSVILTMTRPDMPLKMD